MFGNFGKRLNLGGISKVLQRNFNDFAKDSGISDESLCNRIFSFAFYSVSSGTGSGSDYFDVDTLSWDQIEDEYSVWFKVRLNFSYRDTVRNEFKFVSDKVSNAINGANIIIHRGLGFKDFEAKFDIKDSYVKGQLKKGLVCFSVNLKEPLVFND